MGPPRGTCEVVGGDTRGFDTTINPPPSPIRFPPKPIQDYPRAVYSGFFWIQWQRRGLPSGTVHIAPRARSSNSFFSFSLAPTDASLCRVFSHTYAPNVECNRYALCMHDGSDRRRTENVHPPKYFLRDFNGFIDGPSTHRCSSIELFFWSRGIVVF